MPSLGTRNSLILVVREGLEPSTSTYSLEEHADRESLASLVAREEYVNRAPYGAAQAFGLHGLQYA
jgi:hypothetical protein